MLNITLGRGWRCTVQAVSLGCVLLPFAAPARPSSPTVSQGAASFSSLGSLTTIKTSDRAVINWGSFNIGLGETVSFVQPSSSSVVWNQINSAAPSQILGNLNANGYVVLQSQSGFSIGGQAVINAQGLVMTTSRMPVPDLSSGSAWQFNALPPSASIINYGQINAGKGGSAFLIAETVENHGVISAPQGNLGLFAGKEVMVSSRPDGRGLSAAVTLPSGSVDNSGKLIADGGAIAMNARVVNQGGLVQANSVRNVNGVIELLAGDSLNLGANSTLSAEGDSAGASSGGTVVLKSGNSFSDQSGSVISTPGGAQGGRGGQVEISAEEFASLHTRVEARGGNGSPGGKLLIDPFNLTLTTDFVDALTPLFDSGMYELSLKAINNITLATAWTLADPGAPALLSLTAGNNIIFNNNSSIKAGNNWSVSLAAGSRNLPAAPDPGNNGIYFKGNSFLQSQDGNLTLWAANEIIVNPGAAYELGSGAPGINGIRTLGGGNITVTTEFGNVNTGGNVNGYQFGQRAAPYYRVSTSLGGISTAAGGDVTIIAGGDVTSFLPTQDDYNNAKNDAGTGAFGLNKPGNVTITAGGSVSGHYVVANGVGTITAGGDIGSPTANGGFALSLVKGSWNVSAPNGNIYVQDIRNPNGIFNDTTGISYAGYHLFDYDDLASVTLTAGQSVEITGAGAPHGVASVPGVSIPTLFPPSLTVNTGPGGFILDTDVTLFPSPSGELNLHTTQGGKFLSYLDPNNPTTLFNYTLSMSDSAARQWDPGANTPTFGLNDHAATPPELNNPNPVVIKISGDMNNVTVHTTKKTEVTVGGNMFNASVLAQNLHATDESFVKVGGSISFSPVYAFTRLTDPIVSADPLLPIAWDSIFSFLVDPNVSLQLPANIVLLTPAQQTAYAYANLRLVLRQSYTLQPGYDPEANPGFIYDPSTKQLGFRYQMSSSILQALNQAAIPILRIDSTGNVAVEKHADGNYYFGTTTASFATPTALLNLYGASQTSVPNSQSLAAGFQIGGPGLFSLKAATLDLGSSGGIVSWGIGSAFNPVDYSFLTPWTPSGAALDLNVTGDITLLSSTIASIFGGKVSVHSDSAIKLSLGDFSLIPPAANLAYGIFTSGHSDVKVTAAQDIDIGGARIAAFNGGTVFIQSDHGSVNAGNGANSILIIPVIYRDSATGELRSGQIEGPFPYGSGVLAILPTANWRADGVTLPGDIIIKTPEGNIVSTLGGIQQYALNGSIASGPSITLDAGTAASGGSPGFVGNVDLGLGGVVGGTININANGTIKGLIVSQQNANITAAQSFVGTLLAGGSASVTATAGTVSGTIVGIGGVSASGGGGVSAAVLGQNVSIGGGAAQSTLGTSAAATSAGQAAAQQANSDTKQQLAADTTSDDEKKKRLPTKAPVLTRRVGKVTVILPKG